MSSFFFSFLFSLIDFEQSGGQVRRRKEYCEELTIHIHEKGRVRLKEFESLFAYEVILPRINSIETRDIGSQYEGTEANPTGARP